MLTIVPIVEGPGDKDAIPILLRRIFSDRLNRYDANFPVVKGNGRQKIESDLAKFLGHARNKPNCSGILVLLDIDVDCPKDWATSMREQIDGIGVGCPVQIVYAKRAYETWFLASLETIRGNRNISDTANIQGDPEDVPNPKDWLTDQMPKGTRYKETTDQPALSARIDIALAHTNSRSFRRLCHAVEQLIEEIESNTP